MINLWVRVILGMYMACFLAVWKFTTAYTIKDYLRNLFKFRSLVFICAQVLMGLQLFNILPLSSFVIPGDIIITTIGLTLAVIGTALAICAKFTMKGSWGPPAQHEIKKQKQLVTTGPYQFTRNPIYIGLILYFSGFELALGSYLVFLVIPFALLFYRAVLVEEKLLTKHFGKEFITYASRVRRFL